MVIGITALGSPGSLQAARSPIRVVIWDEQQPSQKPAYANFLGNQIAQFLQGREDLLVRSVSLNDPDQGLPKIVLDECDVLIWWGHVRQSEIKPQTGREIVRRIEEGNFSMITLHSAHWSTPFVEAMNQRARQDALATLLPEERSTVRITEKTLYPKPYTVPKYGDPLTPRERFRKKSGGAVELTLTLPNCCFPAYRNDGKPSLLVALRPDHPVALGIPPRVNISQTEMYDEPFHVPPPDMVFFEERWPTGEWFRSAMVWGLGKGKVFYFRPGHETYPLYKETVVLRILENAVRWLGAELP